MTPQRWATMGNQRFVDPGKLATDLGVFRSVGVMQDHESGEPIKLYLDQDSEPFKVAPAPLTFQFNTIALPDGPHTLRIEASNGLAPPTIKEIPFVVRNGVAITVSGLDSRQTIAGQVQMVINAYAGNTEVDFEPRRAETPQPIPTWAWVVLLGVIAWTLWYVLNPTVPSSEAATVMSSFDRKAGDRIYTDTCARCHGEDGRGLRPKVPPLRDADIALAPTPAGLLIKVTASDAVAATADDTHVRMPEWGTRLTNEEIVAVVNHVRHSWGHDGSQIELKHRRPPPGIEELHRNFSRALKTRDVQSLAGCCIPTTGIEPRIYRTDGVHERGKEGVLRAWQTYLRELGEAGSTVTQISLPDARYDYEPATVEQDGSVVIGTGRFFLETTNQSGAKDRAKGRFIRVYQHHQGRWVLAFDFADVRMAVGCEPGTVICPPEGEEGTTQPLPLPTLPDPAPPTPPGPKPAPADGAIGYGDVQEMIKALNKDSRSAPHENFWTFSYQEFVSLRFPEDWGEDGMMRLLIPGNAKESNLIRALRTGKGIVVDLPGGSTKIRDDLQRMPKGGTPMPEEDIQKIEAWIDAGCPEFAGKPSTLPAPGETPAAPAPGQQPPPADPFVPSGFPPPQAGDQPAPPPGFPPPQPDQPEPPPPVSPFPPPAGDLPAEGPSATKQPVISYAEVQELLGKMGRSVSPPPSPAVWAFSLPAFLQYRFPLRPGAEPTLALVTPGDGRASNLVRALKRGTGILVSMPDGTLATIDVPGIPRGGLRLNPEEIGKIEAWIDAGCPEKGSP